MTSLFLLLIIGLAVAVGCYVGQKHLVEMGEYQPSLSSDYFAGLNYLINEQPDKAVDVFTKLLQVDSETVDTHFALGSLFRRQGEISRAIKIHQNLIARPHLPKHQRDAALVALGKDYFEAGLIDRAEKIFTETTHSSHYALSSLSYLLEIYQQQQKWSLAIKTAEQLKPLLKDTFEVPVAHYYCELAEQHFKKNEMQLGVKSLKQALKIDVRCVRANLRLSRIFLETKEYKAAIMAIENIVHQDDIFFSEALKIYLSAHQALNQLSKGIDFLKTYFVEKPYIEIMIVLTEFIKKNESEEKAIEFLMQFLHKFPSLRGLVYLLELKNSDDYLFLKAIIINLLKNNFHYRCMHCGFKSNQLLWLCPGCHRWSQIKPVAY